MAWWIWVLGGLVLLVAEVTTPGGFFAVFFGAGAILVGVAKALGWPGPAWAEWLVFTRALRRLARSSSAAPHAPLQPRRAGRAVDRLEGERPRSCTRRWLPAGWARPRCAARRWSARTAGAVALAPGQRCRVEQVEGLTLWLRAE